MMATNETSKNLSDCCTVGTDGEEQLSNAFATFFLKLQSCCVHSINVIILKQQLHKRDNIKTTTP